MPSEDKCSSNNVCVDLWLKYLPEKLQQKIQFSISCSLCICIKCFIYLIENPLLNFFPFYCPFPRAAVLLLSLWYKSITVVFHSCEVSVNKSGLFCVSPAFMMSARFINASLDASGLSVSAFYLFLQTLVASWLLLILWLRPESSSSQTMWTPIMLLPSGNTQLHLPMIRNLLINPQQ